MFIWTNPYLFTWSWAKIKRFEQEHKKIQISRTTFFRLAQSGQVPGAKKVGDSWRIDRDQLRAYFQGREDSGGE